MSHSSIGLRALLSLIALLLLAAPGGDIAGAPGELVEVRINGGAGGGRADGVRAAVGGVQSRVSRPSSPI